MRTIIILVIVFSMVDVAMAQSFSSGDIEWADAVTSTLRRGDSLKSGEYTVEAVEFSGPVFGIKDIGGSWVPEREVDPMVILRIYKDDIVVQELGMDTISEAYIDPNYEVKISTTGFPPRNDKIWIYQYYDPWVDVSVQLRGRPNLEVTVETDKSEYNSEDRDITVKVIVTNKGNAFAKNIDVDLDIGELKLRSGNIGQLHQYYSRMDKSGSENFEITFYVPDVVDIKTYKINATVKGYDIEDDKYNATGSTSITVLPRPIHITIDKFVKDNMFLRETATVWITIVNGGTYNIYDIYVNDSMEQHFELIANTSLQWHISLLKPGEEWKKSYIMKPTDVSTDGFTIPGSVVRYTANNKQYAITTRTLGIIVNGPKIILEKRVDNDKTKMGDNVVVFIRVNNVGNVATKVNIKDSLPGGVTLIKGNLSNSAYIEPNKPREFSYIVKTNTNEEIVLPKATANYTDMERMELIKSGIMSNTVTINTKKVENISVTAIPTISIEEIPVEEPQKGVPDIIYKGILLISIVLIIIYLKRRR